MTATLQGVVGAIGQAFAQRLGGDLRGDDGDDDGLGAGDLAGEVGDGDRVGGASVVERLLKTIAAACAAMAALPLCH